MPISKINTFGIADNAVISSKIAQDIPTVQVSHTDTTVGWLG